MWRFLTCTVTLLVLVLLLVTAAGTKLAEGLPHDVNEATRPEQQTEHVKLHLHEVLTPTSVYTYYFPIIDHNQATPTWQSLGLRGMEVRSIAVDPNGVLYAGTNDYGLYKSVDSGDNWYSINNGLWDDATILQVEVDPYDAQTVYACTNKANPFFFYSQNGGESWQPRGDFSHPPLRLRAHPVVPGHLVIGDAVLDWAGGRLYKSDDSGMSWRMVITEQVMVNAIATSEVSPSLMYAGAFHGLYRSGDGGDTWMRVTNGLPDGSARAVAIDPAVPLTAYVSIETATYKTTDGGSSWSLWGSNLPPYGVFNLQINRNNPEIHYATSGPAGVYVSVDGGTNWQALNSGLGSLNVYSLILDQAASDLLAATADGVWSLRLVEEKD